MTLSSSRKLLVTEIISFLLICIFAGAIWWLSTRVYTAQAEIQKLHQEISTLEADWDRNRRLEGTLDKRKGDIDRMTSVLVDKNRPIEFIQSLEEIEKKTGIDLKKDIVEDKSAAATLTFNAVLSGNEPNVRSALALIEHLPYIITIEEATYERSVESSMVSVQTTRKKTGTDVPVGKMTIRLKVKTL